MADSPPPDEVSVWQRRLAAQANNRAWSLSESLSRSPEEDEEMLQAAHAAMHFFKIVGDANTRAHAALLVAHVYALLKLPNPAKHYWERIESVFLAQDCKPWDRALAFAVKACVAASAGESEPHTRSLRMAEQLVAALPDAEDREILNATVRVIPRPTSAGVA